MVSYHRRTVVPFQSPSFLIMFDQIIDWSKIDEESDIRFGGGMFGFVLCSLLSLDEAGTYRLDTDGVLMGNEQDTLVSQFIHEVLLDTLEAMVVARDPNFVSASSIISASVKKKGILPGEFLGENV